MFVSLPRGKARCVLLLVCIFVCTLSLASHAQKRRLPIKIVSKSVSPKISNAPKTAIVINERLSVLRFEPSLFSIPLQRVSHGRSLQVLGEKDVEGLKFYRVSSSTEKGGWVQAEAVILLNRKGEDERLARLIQASEGFEQFERISIFLENFPKSVLRPAILLLFGDLAESVAQKLSNDANRRFDSSEIRASGATMKSYFLNFNSLDRYRRQGLTFLFSEKTRRFHYDGATWQEIIKSFPQSSEAAEAQKRLDNLKTKMAAEK